jgi:NlpC/P60 family putative phage cell wall peptidase
MRKAIIAEARSWVGTPFHHQGRVKGAGVDCVGLAIMVGKSLGLVDAGYDFNGYRRMPYGSTLIDAIRNCGFVNEVKTPEPGDVLVFRIDTDPEHVAFLSDTNTLIHAYAPARKVAEARYDSQWQKKCVTAFKFKGIDSWQY